VCVSGRSGRGQKHPPRIHKPVFFSNTNTRITEWSSTQQHTTYSHLWPTSHTHHQALHWLALPWSVFLAIYTVYPVFEQAVCGVRYDELDEEMQRDTAVTDKAGYG